MNGIIKRNNPSKNPFLSPEIVPEGKFIGSRETWFYNKDGTIRNKWDSINNQNGSCLHVVENSGKCTDDSFKSEGNCLSNKKKWMQKVGLTKNNHKCGTFTWDAYGRLLYNGDGHSSNIKNCLIPVKTTNNKIITGLETCATNDLSDKHLWTFY